MSYRVIASLAIATDQGGRHRNYYHGAIIPWLSEAQAKHLVGHRLVEKVREAPKKTAEPTAVAADGAPHRPNKVAPKEDWVKYVASLPGKDTAEVLDANFTKLELQDLADE
jgi:hypothetical protein